jgi:hypothetical protein
VRTQYYVEAINHEGERYVVSGMGRNRGTWDSAANSKRTAQRWARELRQSSHPVRYFVREQ